MEHGLLTDSSSSITACANDNLSLGTQGLCYLSAGQRSSWQLAAGARVWTRHDDDTVARYRRPNADCPGMGGQAVGRGERGLAALA